MREKAIGMGYILVNKTPTFNPPSAQPQTPLLTSSHHHSLHSPSSRLLTLAFAQYAPLTSPISPNASLTGIFAPSSGVFGARPTNRPISVFTQPGQHALISKPGFSRARMRVKALTQALEKA